MATTHDNTSQPEHNSTPTTSDEILPTGERRKGERRQSNQRREGARGMWEERRLYDRRAREYSMFGKRLDGSDEDVDVSKIPDVAPELLISPAEVSHFREQEREEQQREELEEIRLADAA